MTRLLLALLTLALAACQSQEAPRSGFMPPPADGTFIGFRFPESTTGGEAGGLFAGAALLAVTGNYIIPSSADHVAIQRVRLKNGDIIEVRDPAMPLISRGARVRVWPASGGFPGRVVPL
jgi:hypothetical protein